MLKKALTCLVIIIFTIPPCNASEKFVIEGQNNAVWHQEKGLLDVSAGDYFDAIDEFKLAIALSPNAAATASFYNNLGTIYWEINRYDWAETCFQRAIKLNPNFLMYYQNLAKTYKLERKLTREIKKNTDIIKKDPDETKSYLMLGLLHKELGNTDDAVYYLNKYTELEPDLIITTGVKTFLNKYK